MHQARDELIQILYQRGTCSVSEFADTIGISRGSVRRHLDIMLGEGLLETELERRPRGRPVTRYSLSEVGEERSSAAWYPLLLERFLPALTRLSENETSGRSGDTILAQVFEQVAEDVAREHSPQVRSEDLGARIDEVVSALRGIGILSDVAEEGETFRLRNVGCPCRSTAQQTHAVCEADRYSIELLIGAPVEQVATIAGGSDSCEYLVSKTAETRMERLELQ